jgi:NAD(P)-dependent dehydrogenase (short-subunit alcohol dehydrogenase family)
MGTRLAGKIALVTGATRGIGAAAAKRLADEGAHVVLLGRSRAALEGLDDSIRTTGGIATLVEIDLAETTKIEELARVIEVRFGRLDILLANAATLGIIGPTGHMDADMFRKVLDINLTANWCLVRAFEPLLRRASDAHAIFTTCAVGREPTAFWSAYAISKAALEMMAGIWAAELTGTRIKVSVVDPGPARTGLRRAAFPAEDPATVPTADQGAACLLGALGL